MLIPSEHPGSVASENALRRDFPSVERGIHAPPIHLGSRQRVIHGRIIPWVLAGGTLLFAWLLLLNKLRADWSANDQYQYGWFVPPLALVLFALRWADRPPPAPLRSSGWTLALLVGGTLLLLPLRLIEEPNPDWRLIFWLHAGFLSLGTLAAFHWAGGRAWLRHFAFPTGFLLLAVPWPSGFEQTVVQSLMRGVAAISAEGMNVLGIPAIAQGNLVHIRDQTVGVSEACSGIRSLQTTLMAGLLLGELSRLRWPWRAGLLGCGLALAMVANVFRSSLLVWIAARHGAAALEQVHDYAGFSVLLIVFAGLLCFDRTFARQDRQRSGRAGGDAAGSSALPSGRVSTRFVLTIALWLLTAETLTAAWYGWYAPRPDQVPRWTATPPAGAPGLQSLPIDHQTSQILRYDTAVSSRWNRSGAVTDECTLFFFRWEPGHASTTQAEMHQPHICLTASGLTEVADWGVEPLTVPGGITLPVRRYEFNLHGRSVFVFFVAWQDHAGAQTLAESAGSRWERLRAVLEHRANLGRQTLELIFVGPPDARTANVSFEREIAAIVHPLQVGQKAVPR